MKQWILFLGLLLLTFGVNTASFAYPVSPDLEVTPSSLCTTEHSDFKEFRYRERIPYCKRNVSTQTKAYIYDLYEVPMHCRKQFTIDHFIPLSIGGDNQIENLWPEHKDIKNSRPNLEFSIYQKLRDGKINQETAIQIIYLEKTSYEVKQIIRSFCS